MADGWATEADAHSRSAKAKAAQSAKSEIEVVIHSEEQRQQATAYVKEAEAAGLSKAEIIKGLQEQGVQVLGNNGNNSVIKGFSSHATNQAITRGFTTTDIQMIVRDGTAVKAIGRYGPQTRYTLGANTVIINAQGRVITVFSNAPGTNRGLGKGFLVPFRK